MRFTGARSFQQLRLPQRGQKIALHVREAVSRNRRPCHQHKIERVRKFMLVQPVGFPQQPLGPAAHHRTADFFPDHHAETRATAFRQAQPVGDKTTSDRPLTVFAHPREITPELDARIALQSAALGRAGHAIKRASGACAPRDDGCAMWLCRSSTISGSENRAAVCGGFSMVDTGVS